MLPGSFPSNRIRRGRGEKVVEVLLVLTLRETLQQRRHRERGQVRRVVQVLPVVVAVACCGREVRWRCETVLLWPWLGAWWP